MKKYVMSLLSLLYYVEHAFSTYIKQRYETNFFLIYVTKLP